MLGAGIWARQSKDSLSLPQDAWSLHWEDATSEGHAGWVI